MTRHLLVFLVLALSLAASGGNDDDLPGFAGIKNDFQDEWAHQEKDTAEKVVVVSLVYDHDSSGLAQKLTHVQHEHHKAVVSSLHVHLDAHNCLEVLILRGRARESIAMGESLVSTKGVKYGKVMPATTGRELK